MNLNGAAYDVHSHVPCLQVEQEFIGQASFVGRVTVIFLNEASKELYSVIAAKLDAGSPRPREDRGDSGLL